MFGIYVQWLYEKKIYSIKEVDDDWKRGDEWARLVRSFILGDAIQDRQFRNAIVDAFIDRTIRMSSWPLFIAEIVWTSLPENSPLRRLVTDF